jgi:hypothetical protein
MGPRVGLNAVEKRKKILPCWESNQGRPARSPSLKLSRLLHLRVILKFSYEKFGVKLSGLATR